MGSNNGANWLTKNLLLTATMSGVIVGVVLGLALRPASLSPSTIRYIGFPGELFMNSLKCIVLPLIAASLISGLSQLEGNVSGKIGSRSVVYYAITLSHAVILGIILVLIIHPGNDELKTASEASVSTHHHDVTISAADKFTDLIRNMVPDNIIQAMFQQKQTSYSKIDKNGTIIIIPNVVFINGMNVLGVIVFCILTGVTLARLGEPVRPLVEVVRAVELTVTAMVRTIMWCGPVGIASLIAEKILLVNNLVDTFSMLFMFMFTVALGLGIQAFITLPGLYFIASRKNPYHFLRGLAQALVTSTGTSSSAVTMPVTFQCLDKLGIDPRVSKFVLPVGTTVNMDGTALYEAVAAVFIAQLNGLQMGIAEVATVAVTATLASIGTAAVPSGGLVTLVLVLSSLGLPASDVGLVMTVDWILGRLRATTNVIGDAFACGVVDALCASDLPPIPSTDKEMVNVSKATVDTSCS